MEMIHLVTPVTAPGCINITVLFLLHRRPSPVSEFATTCSNVIHMEPDLYQPGNIVYTDQHALMSSDGINAYLITGNSTQPGYKEGARAQARFHNIYGFTQVSEKTTVLADTWNHCLRTVDRVTGVTSTFSGRCDKAGYGAGRPGQFRYPYAVARDVNDADQLLITDSGNKAVRTVAMKTGVAGTFVKSDLLAVLRYLTQDKDGNMFVTAGQALYRISYNSKKITLIAGSPSEKGYKDLDLTNSRFNYPFDVALVGPGNLLVGDPGNQKVRFVDLNANQVSTINMCNGCSTLRSPHSMLIHNGSMYIGQNKRIQKYAGE